MSAQGSLLLKADILKVSADGWQERRWESRRELPPSKIPSCDQLSSMALACLAKNGGSQPLKQRFLTAGAIDAWVGDFGWGQAWVASSYGNVLSFSKFDDGGSEIQEISGPQSMVDEELADQLAQAWLTN